MKRDENGITYAVEQRMRFIDFLLQQYGHINRSALEDFFGISEPQASNDLGLYDRIAPGNMVYDKKRKAYVKTLGFWRKYL